MLSNEHWSILRWTAFHRGIVVVLLFLGSISQSPFDSSAWIQLRLDATSSSLSTVLALPFLRWDTLHFLAMASPRPLPLPASISYAGQLPSQARGGGVQSEQSLAFQPGIVWMLRIFGSQGGSDLKWNPTQAVLLTSVLAAILSMLMPLLLFSLTKRLTGDDRFSKVSAYLSILSPSPGTLISPTPESFFSFFALLGHLCILSSSQSSRQILKVSLAAICYALTTAFRSNGILFIGFVVWQIFWDSSRQKSLLSILVAPVSMICCVVPFLLSQGFAYSRFCSSGVIRRPWCDNSLPSVYTFVQKCYWNMGLFKYWTVSQLPNWILASPVLVLAAFWILPFYRTNLQATITKTFAPWRESKASSFILPHVHFTLITLIILIVNSHVQIALRFASPGGLPAVWWGASKLLTNYKSAKVAWLDILWADVLIAYLVLWNLSSVILYAGFYPPA